MAMNFFLGFADSLAVDRAAARAEGRPGVRDHPARNGHTGIDIVFQGKVNETLDISLKLILAFGLCFQLPVLLTLMGKAGLVTARGLAGMRKYAIVLILIVAALVTPPDVLSQMILFGAVYPLYEVSIFLIRRIEKKREAEARADGTCVDEDEEKTRPRMTDDCERIAEALERMAPAPAPAPDFAAPGLCLAHRIPTGWSRSRGCRGWTWRCWSASTGPATRCWPIPGISPRGCRRTTRCSGARAAWENPAWSRRSTPRFRAEGEDLKIVELSREDLPSVARLLAHAARGAGPLHPVLRRSVVQP
jgi:hypothetical protein